MARYRALTYPQIRDKVVRREVDTYEHADTGGVLYQVEFLFFWDGKPEQDIRVVGSVFCNPMGESVSEDFILSPDGTFVDE